jgi:hypothetical protein
MNKNLVFATIAILAFSNLFGQVNLNTGGADVNIPLYNYTDDNNHLKTAVNLAWTASNGIKVSEIPSAVGSGWNMEAGGYIERMQNGEPDDQKQYQANWVPTSSAYFNYYPDGYLYTTYSNTSLVKNNAAYTKLMNNSTLLYKPTQDVLADREQDVFYFNFNGRKGRFIIGRPDQNNVNQIRTIEDSKLVISKVDQDMTASEIRTTITEFDIKDEQGVVYKFKDHQLSYTCRYDSTVSYPNSMEVTKGRINNGLVNRYVINKWYLSEIVYPLTNNKIQFQYQSYQYDLESDKYYSKAYRSTDNKYTLVIGRMIGSDLRLTRIIASAKEEVDFVYSVSNRIDLPFDRSLDQIQVKYDNQTKYAWKFGYGYFVKSDIKLPFYQFTDEDKHWARLCLLNFTRVGDHETESKPFSFTYYMGNEDGMTSGIPPMFSYLQDSWGYFNGSGVFSNTNDPNQGGAIYEPYGGDMGYRSYYESILNNPSYYKTPTLEARNGMIKSVKSPLGGETDFEYVQQIASGNHPVGGVKVSKTIVKDGMNSANDQVLEYNYTDANGNSSLWGYENLDATYSTSVSSFVNNSCNNVFPGHDYTTEAMPLAKLPFAPFKMDGAIGLPASLRTLMVNPEECILGLIQIILNYGSSGNTYIYTTMQQSKSLMAGHLLPIQYARVEVIRDLGSATAGKTVYEFTSPGDATSNQAFAIDVPTLSAPYSARQRCASWLYGATKKISYYKNGDATNPVKVVENIYTPVKYTLTDDLNASQKWAPNMNIYQCDLTNHGYDFNATNAIDHDVYRPICGRLELAATNEYNYGPSLAYNEQSTSYFYNANFQPKKKTTTNSKGESLETNLYYPADYTGISIMQNLVSNNILNVPVASQTFIHKGTNVFLLNGDVTELATAADGDIKPLKHFSFEYTQPLDQSLVPFSASQLVPNATYYRKNKEYAYDVQGWIKQVSDDQGISCSITDYDRKLITATVFNATPDQVAYTSFEAENKGGWTYDEQYIVKDFCPTGYKLFSYPSASTGIAVTRAGLSTSTQYILALWAKTGTTPYVYKTGTGNVVTACPLLRSYVNAATGWTYYEYTVSNATNVSVDNSFGGQMQASNNLQVDELRLFPVNALMRTTTYSPLIGKISDCDENGRITYYDYDDMGRLKTIKDENRHVKTGYVYNTKQ